MIWNVFFVVFVVLVLAAIGLTVWFLKLGKRIFLLIPLLLLAGSVAYFAVYYTADNNFPPAQVMIASNFPSTVDSALVEEACKRRTAATPAQMNTTPAPCSTPCA